MDEEYNIKINTERREKEFWIARDGKVHKYNGPLNEELVSIHSEIARELFPNHLKPKDMMMKTGWLMVGSVVYSTPIIDIAPTQAQLNTLFDIDEWLFERFCFLHGGYYLNYKENKHLLD
ncbi:MAG: hypothetical protein WC333_02300 [Dehalococcoidia bacterium]|jgi:hypothetical protein